MNVQSPTRTPLPPTHAQQKGDGGGGGGGGGGGDFKRPRYQSSSWASSLQAVRNGQAILFTCDVGREAKAAKEMSVVLERVSASLFEGEKPGRTAPQHTLQAGSSTVESMLFLIEQSRFS